MKKNERKIMKKIKKTRWKKKKRNEENLHAKFGSESLSESVSEEDVLFLCSLKHKVRRTGSAFPSFFLIFLFSLFSLKLFFAVFFFVLPISSFFFLFWINWLFVCCICGFFLFSFVFVCLFFFLLEFSSKIPTKRN